MLVAMVVGMVVLMPLSMLLGDAGVEVHLLMLPAMALAMLCGREEYVHG